MTTLEMNNIVFRLPSLTNLFHFLYVLYKCLEMNNIVFRLPSLTNLFHFLHALYKFITTLEMNNIVFRLLSLTNLFHFLHVLYDCVLWSSRRYQYIYSNLYLTNCIQKFLRFKQRGKPLQNFFCGFSRTLRFIAIKFLKIRLNSEEQLTNDKDMNLYKKSIDYINLFNSLDINLTNNQLNNFIFMRENGTKIYFVDISNSLKRHIAQSRDYNLYCDYNHNNYLDYLALTTAKRSYEESDNDNLVKFIIDSGCSNHLTNADIRHMYKCVQIDSTIGTAGGPPLRSSRKGSIGPLVNVLHVPDAKFSLLSISNFCDEGITVIFNRDEVLFVNNEDCNRWIATLHTVQRGFRDNNLYAINIDVSDKNRSKFIPHESHQSLVANAESINRYTLWHQRFNHCGH